MADNLAMELEILKIGSACTGCFACYNACNYGALSMKEDEEGFVFPELDKDACIGCKKCDSVCPELKLDTTACENKSPIMAGIMMRRSEKRVHPVAFLVLWLKTYSIRTD